MKYFSEKLNQLFDSEEALKSAELSSSRKRAVRRGISAAGSAEELNNSHSEDEKIQTRKELAANVETAETAVADAYAEYELAKQKVQEISKKYLEDVNSILDPAKEKVKLAEQARYDAIKKFNESYGAYQVTYTGDKAAQELIKALTDMDMNSFYNKFIRFPF